jgi:hypothetical protein
MSYTKLCKQWEKEFNQKKKICLTETTTRKEKEEKINSLIICEDLLNRIKAKEQQKYIIEIKDNILLQLRDNNPFAYNQFLILWDIFNNNYEQILNDLNRNRITKNDIILIINYIEKFNTEIIKEYYKKLLLAG